MSHWLRPLCCSRTGAAHRRRGVVCQDASGWLAFQDRHGELVQLMAVADGHGGARYGRSDVGSWLACRAALITGRQLFQRPAASAASPWLEQQWLGQAFHRAIQRRWLQAVQRHWRRQRPAEGSEAFSPLLYGTTLGLVVMTPRWWGHTGLGDWDLLQLQAGAAQLLSQESDPAAAGEATFSLCLEDAATHFAPRSAIQYLDPATEPLALVLSTDGIRKSCSTDDDFLALGRYLSQAPLALAGEDAIDLAASLDHISSQGSGDDGTVAIAHWLPADDKRRPFGQDSGLAPARPQLQPRRPRSLEGPRRRPVAEPVADGPLQADAPQAGPIAAPRPAPQGQPRPGTGRRPLIALAWLLAAVLIGGLAAVALTPFRFGGLGRATPPQAPALPVPMEAQRLAAMRQQVRQLCAEVETIRPLLEPRRPSFRALRWGWRQRQQLLAARDGDPLEALIALSYDPASGTVSHGPQLGGLGICPPLQQALTQLWLESQGSAPAAH